MALLHPVNGSRCSLMSDELGLGRWEQSVDAAQCRQQYVYRRAFAEAVAQECWESGAPTTETGSQYAVTFNSYRTQVEVVQQGLAPFGQTASRSVARDDTTIERAFRRDYTISVATQFKAQSQPFSVIAPIVLVGPTCVADTASTPQTQPVTTDLLANDVAGTTGGETEPLLLSTLQLVGDPPAHGTVALDTTTGQATYTPTGLYHGSDSYAYQVCDANALCSGATVTVLVTPVPPSAVADAAQTEFQTPVEVPVLANDVAGAGALTTLTIVTPPSAAQGTASVTGANGILFTPAADWTGTVTMEYRICDNSVPTSLCDTAELLVALGPWLCPTVWR